MRHEGDQAIVSEQQAFSPAALRHEDAEAPLRNVEARDVALAAAQRRERVEAALVLQLEGAGATAFRARGARGTAKSWLSVDDESRTGSLGQGLVQRSSGFRGQVVELRGEARLR